MLSIGGLAFLWPLLHASPYYPLSLAPTFSSAGIADISANHIVYAVLLLCLFALVVGLRRHVHSFLEHTRLAALTAGAAGLLGSVLLVVSGGLGAASIAVIGIGFMLVAFCVVALVVAWLSMMADTTLRGTAVPITLSYCVFSAVWFAMFALGIDTVFLLVVCPAISAACLAAMPAGHLETGSFSFSSLKSLPWGVIALCIVFVYFGVVCVRMLTAMQLGAESAGGLSAVHQMVTAGASLVICAGIALYCRRRDYALNTLITVFAALALVYMAALLLVMVGGSDSSLLALIGKRALVAAEHCLEVFAAIVCACNVARRRLSPTLVFGLYAIVILVIPQMISLDFMYQSGFLDALAHMYLVILLAAVTSFLVAAVSMSLLVSYFSRAVKRPAEVSSDWEERLCRRATASIGTSAREFEVIVLTYRGYSARRIAETLYVSESTVKTHLSHAYRKLSIHSKQDLIELIDGYRDDVTHA